MSKSSLFDESGWVEHYGSGFGVSTNASMGRQASNKTRLPPLPRQNAVGRPQFPPQAAFASSPRGRGNRGAGANVSMRRVTWYFPPGRTRPELNCSPFKCSKYRSRSSRAAARYFGSIFSGGALGRGTGLRSRGAGSAGNNAGAGSPCGATYPGRLTYLIRPPTRIATFPGGGDNGGTGLFWICLFCFTRALRGATRPCGSIACCTGEGSLLPAVARATAGSAYACTSFQCTPGGMGNTSRSARIAPELV